MNVWRRPQAILLLVAIALLACTFTYPTMEWERRAYRYVFVFDITQSMNVADVVQAEPLLTRLDVAKRTVAETLPTLPCGTEAGLALFTGHRAFLLITPVEICANYRELSIMLGNIDWRMTWEAKSEVAKGLYKSMSLMQELKRTTRLVFLTDGHEAPPINPDLPPQFAGVEGDVRGLIVGVGGDKPVPIPKFDATGKQTGFWRADDVTHIDAYSQARGDREGVSSTASGTEHLSSLRETYLKSLAVQTGLAYSRLGNTRAFSKQIRSKHLGIPTHTITDMRWLFALGSLCALGAMLGMTLSDSWRSRARA